MSGPLPAADTTVLAFADRLYERAEDENGWEGALQELADTLRGSAMALHRYDVRAQRGTAVKILRGPSLDEFGPIYKQYAGNNVWMKNLSKSPLPRPGEVISSHRLYPERDFLEHGYYNEFLKNYGLFASVGAVLDVCDHQITTVTILRDRQPGSFREDEERFLGRVCPHLSNVHRIAQRFAAARSSRAVLDEVLERLPTAVFALAPDLRVVLANRFAERLMDGGDGIRNAHGRLQLGDRAAARSLRQAVAELDRARVGEGATAAGAFPIERPSYSRPYTATAMPMRPLVSWDAACGACCLLLVDDPEVQQRPSKRRLMQLWGLTAAEARVASLVAAGWSPREIADHLEIAFSTVRTHLQRIFVKTDTSRQGDLVRLLNRLGLTFADLSED